MSREQMADDTQGVLHANMSSSDTSFQLDSITGIGALPTQGTFRVRIGQELLLVTNVSGSPPILTVTRGDGGTTPVAHNAGDTVSVVLSKNGLSQLLRDRILTGSYSSIPAAAEQQRLFLPTDSPNFDADNGTAWNSWGPIWPINRPSPTGFSDVIPSGSGFTSSHGSSNGIEWISASNGDVNGPHVRARVMTAPSTPYSITALFEPSLLFMTAWATTFGLCWRNSSTGSLITFGYEYVSSSALGYFAAKYSSPIVFNSTYVGNTLLYERGPMRWLKILDDGTNRKCMISADGVNFITVHSVGRTDFITADQVGWFVDPEPINQVATLSLLSWKQGTS